MMKQLRQTRDPLRTGDVGGLSLVCNNRFFKTFTGLLFKINEKRVNKLKKIR
jgi:hypothetical protein